MAGLGKYKKGAKFTLKSGNKPTFTQMGSSPANLNNFGIGPGGSPYKQDDEKTETNAQELARLKQERADSKVITGEAKEPGKEAKVGDKKEKGWVKALKIGTTLLSGGIQGVYGGSRHAPKINWGKWTQEELDKSAADRILEEEPPLPKTQAEKDAEALKLKNNKEVSNNEE